MQIFKKKHFNQPNDSDNRNNVLDYIGAMYVEIDQNNVVTSVNDYACMVLEYSRSEVIGKNWFENFVPKTEESLSFGTQNDYEEFYDKPIRTKSGRERLISWRKTVVKNKNNGHRSICVGQDITNHDNYLFTLQKIASLLLDGENKVPYRRFAKLVAEAANADHTYIFLNKRDETGGFVSKKICEWGRGEFIENADVEVMLQKLSLSMFRETLVKKLSAGEVINKRTSTFTQSEQELLLHFGIKAILLIPIMVKNNFYGFIGFDNRVNDRRWTNSEIEFLKASVKNLEQKIIRSYVDDALLNENQRFQATMDAIEVMVLVSSFETGKIVYGNSYASTHLGNIVGSKTQDVLKLPQTHADTNYGFQSLVKNNQPISVVECEVTSAANHVYSCQIKAIKWSDGEWVRLETITDITYKKQSEIRLLESEARFKKLSAISVEGIIIHDQGVIIEANQAFLDLVEYNYEDVLGKNIIELAVSPESRELLLSKIKERTPKPYEIIGINSRGEKIPLEIFARSMEYNGEDLRVVAVRDITERKKTEKELIRQKNKAEESNRLKTQFLNNLSHEIRTPLNGIVGFTQFLDDPHLTEENRKNFVSIIQNSSHQLVRVIDDIIEISKLETKQVKPLIEPVNFNTLLLEMFSIFELKSIDKGVALHLNRGLTDYQSYIYTDKTKLSKILNNLVENALKFTHVGEVEIGYSLENEMLSIWVKDSGIGIEESQQKVIFDRFSQAKQNKPKDYGGLGLGLSIAKENVELLGGNLKVQSSLNEGATFIFEIPYNPVNEVAKEDESELSSGSESVDYTVLIAEDEEVNFIFLEFLLNKMKGSIQINHARNGQEAIDYFANGNSADLVFMDLKMPQVDGFEATKVIHGDHPSMPIVAVTAFSGVEDRKNAKTSGCVDFITKPIAVDEFKEKCAFYLKGLEV